MNKKMVFLIGLFVVLLLSVGSVSAGLSIYDTMNYITNKCITIGMGLCASMGAFLLSSGEKGKRYAATNILFIAFIITSVINGAIVRGLTVNTPLDIKPMIADLVIVMVIGAFAYFIKPKHRYIYFLIMSILLTAICIINTVTVVKNTPPMFEGGQHGTEKGN